MSFTRSVTEPASRLSSATKENGHFSITQLVGMGVFASGNVFERMVTDPKNLCSGHEDDVQSGFEFGEDIDFTGSFDNLPLANLEEFEAAIQKEFEQQFDMYLQQNGRLEIVVSDEDLCDSHSDGHDQGALYDASRIVTGESSTREFSSVAAADFASTTSAEDSSSDGVSLQASVSMVTRTNFCVTDEDEQTPRASSAKAFIENPLASNDTAMIASSSSKPTQYLCKSGVMAVGVICISLVMRKHMRAIKC